MLKSKDIQDLCQINVFISKLFIQCDTGSCCVHVTGGVSIYLQIRVLAKKQDNKKIGGWGGTKLEKKLGKQCRYRRVFIK